MIYVDPQTGEILDAAQPGCIEIPDEDMPEPTQTEADAEWLGDWLTKQLVRLDAEHEALLIGHDLRMRQVHARWAALAYRYDERMEAVLRAEIAGTKARSVKYAFGVAALRKSTVRVVENGVAALAWAQEHFELAVKVTPDSLLKGQLPDGCPHLRLEEHETFSVKAHKGAA